MTEALVDAGAILVDRPNCYEDLQARPNFRASLDHKVFALRAVLTNYDFPKKVPCGLKSCHQPHLHGYLVLTDGGGETNIGKDCGKTHFGEEVFSSARADYVRRRERDDLEKRAKHIQAMAPAIQEQIRDLMYRAFGCKWAVKVKTELVQLIGPDLVDSLRVASLRGDLGVTKSRQRSEEEIDDFVALNPRTSRDQATYVVEPVGHLVPMPWLDFDFRERLMVKLHGPLQSFCELVPEAMLSPKLKTEVKQFDDCERTLQDASDAAAAALQFLSRDNLLMLANWLPESYKTLANNVRQWVGGDAHTALLSGAPK